MVSPRMVLFYVAPPVVLGTLLGVYRLWFAGEPESEPPPAPPPAQVGPPAGGLSPFGDPSAGGGAAAGNGATATQGVTGPAPVAGGTREPAYDVGAAGQVLGQLAAGLFASFPEVAQWVAAPDMLRRGVAAVDCVAQGSSPRYHLSFIEMAQPFQVAQTAKGTVIAPASFSRYDRIVALFCHGEAGTLAATYRRIEPALDLAYRQLGYGEGRFRDILAKASAEVLAVPVPAEPVYVVPSGQGYAFADGALQSQSDARKHLLRLGPANLRRVQARVRELTAAIDRKAAP